MNTPASTSSAQPVVDPHITIRGLAKRFRGQTVYDRFDLDLPRGAIVSVFGPNGCGKSTLINMISGIMPRDGARYCLTGVRSRKPASDMYSRTIGKPFSPG
jgi:NitT/TauT family transport system ATP-binding protein